MVQVCDAGRRMRRVWSDGGKPMRVRKTVMATWQWLLLVGIDKGEDGEHDGSGIGKVRL